MHIVSERIIQEIISTAQRDQQHQMLLAQCRELEEAYSRVMEGLSEAERTVIDDYFLASCQMQLDLLRVAYQCGKRSAFPLYPKF